MPGQQILLRGFSVKKRSLLRRKNSFADVFPLCAFAIRALRFVLLNYHFLPAAFFAAASVPKYRNDAPYNAGEPCRSDASLISFFRPNARSSCATISFVHRRRCRSAVGSNPAALSALS